MGNCPKCDQEQPELYFNYENRNNVINFVLIKTENNNKCQAIILDNIKQEDQDSQFQTILNLIINNIEKIKESKIIALKEAIDSTLSNISNTQSINLYLTYIDKYIKNKFDYEAIAKISEIFKLIYSKKEKIKNDDIEFLIKNINNALKGSGILNEQLFKYFFDKINKLFFGDKEEVKKIEPKEINKKLKEEEKELPINNLITNEPKKTENEEKIVINGEREENIISIKSNNSINNEEVDKYITSEKSKSISNYSKYTEDSKKQILKMKEYIKTLKKKISDYENEKDKNEIIFSNDNQNYSIKIKKNQEESIDKIIDQVLKDNPELKQLKYIIKTKVDDKEINPDEIKEKETCNFTNFGQNLI